MCQMKFQLSVVCVPGNVTKGFEAAVTVIAVLREQDSRIHQGFPAWSDEMHICEISSVDFIFTSAPRRRPWEYPLKSPLLEKDTNRNSKTLYHLRLKQNPNFSHSLCAATALCLHQNDNHGICVIYPRPP